jgi:hypothetical protein
MPEDAKPRNPSASGRWWLVAVLGFLLLAAVPVLDTWASWYAGRVSEHAEKVAREVEAKAQAACPVGSTRRQVEDWLEANKFSSSLPVSEKRKVDDCLAYLHISAKDATSCIHGMRPIADGSLGESTHIYFFFGPDEKLITLHTHGDFHSL